MNIRWIGLLITVAMAGCDSGPTGDIVDTVPASGTLTFNGTPLEYYQVAFFPQDNRPAVGITDDQGRFTLGTNGENDGAVVGTHGVAVTYVGKPSDNPDEGIMEFTPPPPPKHKIPGKYNSAETSGLTVEIPSDGTSDLKLEIQ
jgi:hypothetical protein